MQIIRIKGRPFRMLSEYDRLADGDIFRTKRPITRADRRWTRVNRTTPNTDISDTVGFWHTHDFYRPIDPLLYAMQQAKEREKRRKQKTEKGQK